ncbi:MAG: CopD family protein [Microbacteriaceae bacterium]
MSVNTWSLVRFVHVVAAMGWVGGQLLLSAVVLPVLRSRLPPAERVPLVRQTAQRFAVIANGGLLPALVATGIALAWHRGVTFGSIDDPGYGRLLGIKLVLVVVSIALAAVHGTIAMSRPRLARPLAIAGLVSSLAIVVFATALVP